LPPKRSSKLFLKEPQATSRFCLQGTDGIRREVKLASSEATGLTPQEVFLKLGFITEEFMEIYAYAHVKQLILEEKGKIGDNIVIGWDPRDTKGDFTSAVVSGVCKAGANALVLGVVPTPLVPMYMLYKNALAGFMVTASHNPKDQNGIKTFCSFRGLKLLPENDVALTRAVLKVNPAIISKLSLKGKRINSRREALKLFYQFSLDPENTWVPSEQSNHIFKDITLVVDAANGSLSEIAAATFRQVGFRKVIEVNAKLNGDVNLESGVADLEGETLITSKMVQKDTGLFAKHSAVNKLLQLGQKNRAAIIEGKLKICGAVFDADGDRFYRLDYDAYKNALIVLNGDATALFQAKYLMTTEPKRYKGSRYVNSVESDLKIAEAVKKLGFRPVLTSVGDKWILLKIALLIVEKQFRDIQKFGDSKMLPSGLLKKWKHIQNKGTLDTWEFEDLESELDRFRQTTKKNITNINENDFSSFAIGNEETGHNITQGFLVREDGKKTPVFFGNGLKSAINTFTATQFLLGSKPTRTYFYDLAHPFSSGFKKTFYIYYIKKELFYKNSKIWRRLKKIIYQEARSKGFNPRFTCFIEEPDMLYISLISENDAPAAIFIRNSGTENKIGINLRGPKIKTTKLKFIGQKCLEILLSSIKDFENHLYKLEQDICKQLIRGPVLNANLKLRKPHGRRVLSEMVKQGLIGLTKKGYALNPLGKWYQSTQDKNI